MHRTVTALAAPLLLLALAGCAASYDPVSPLPTPEPIPAADATQGTAAQPDDDARFLTLLNLRRVPYTGTSPRADASVVCADLASGVGTRDQVAELQDFPEQSQRRWFVDSAVEVYCPELG
jgi:hypothetical protein